MEPICIQVKKKKKAYVSLRVYTAQMRLWRCGMHVSPNWLKSIGNRKRCAEYYTVARSGTAEMLACLPPHVMASHEHTYIWSPTAASSETDKGWSSLTFHFLFLQKKKREKGRPRLGGGSCSPPSSSQLCFDFHDFDVSEVDFTVEQQVTQIRFSKWAEQVWRKEAKIVLCGFSGEKNAPKTTFRTDLAPVQSLMFVQSEWGRCDSCNSTYWDQIL